MSMIIDKAAEYEATLPTAVTVQEAGTRVRCYLAGAKAVLEMAAKVVEREKRVQGLARVTLAAQIRNLIPTES